MTSRPPEETDRWTDRATDGPERQTDRRESDGRVMGQTDRQTDECCHRERTEAGAVVG